MEFRFCLQDPTHVGTTYLYEAIIEAVIGAASWRGVYAFASRDGVDCLINDPVVEEFMHQGGQVDLLVGLDAVTNRPTLERLQELECQNERFRPRVFWNETTRLFHPKLSDFSYANGSRTLIVGSGNLTPGGLVTNYEGYTVIVADKDEKIDVSALDEFLEHHADEIRLIDDEVLERAAQNVVRSVKRGQKAGGMVTRWPRRPGNAGSTRQTVPAAKFDRILIAQVPKAGDRWAQAHFNKDVVLKYFHLRITDFETKRVYLTHVAEDGARADVEVRACVYSRTNKNLKIEIGAAKDRKYPETPPVLVFRERQLRVFDYMLLFPRDDGYRPLIELVGRLPTIGRGLPRMIVDMDTLTDAWATCPLLTPEESV